MTTTPFPPIDLLDAGDDPDLWRVAVAYILAEFIPEPGDIAEVGRCSHWLRPHQSRWRADGGFALPAGYGGSFGGSSGMALPQFDWSVVAEWDDSTWTIVRRRSHRPVVRIAIPARTNRHLQAAIHTLWTTGREKEAVLYGFRKRDETWVCTATSEPARSREPRP